MRIKSFVQQLELNNELIQPYIKSYNNKCLNKIQKILSVILIDYSNRNDIYE